MKEQIHEQISYELKSATKLDIKIVIIAIVVSLILFGLAMGFAMNTTDSIRTLFSGGSSSVVNTAPVIIMFVSLAAIFAVIYFSVQTLLNNKKQRAKLNKGLVKLFKDEGVAQYYDGSIFKGYETRYNLFVVMLISVGAVSIIAPLVTFINQLIEM
jgi:hypothetical protein